MKLTTSEYLSIFGGKSKESITAQCRNGELDAEKNDKGAWIINVSVPEEVYNARMKAIEKRAYADALFREYKKTEKEIENLMSIVIDFRNARTQQ